MALAFVPGAAEPVSYAKRHLIPRVEDRYRAGTGSAMLAGSGVGLAICKDLDFHDTGAAYARLGASLLLVPAWDFGADGWLHSRMAVMRGVESGFAVARAARSGNLTLADSRGRVVAEKSDEQGDAHLTANVALFDAGTLFARWGNWFAWVCVLLLLLLGGREIRPRWSASTRRPMEPAG
jgi:apolipoprotein N-acyltransferase